MYSCVLHQWNSYESMCPMCLAHQTASASGIGNFIITGHCKSCTEKDQEIERLKSVISFYPNPPSQQTNLEELKAENERLKGLIEKLWWKEILSEYYPHHHFNTNDGLWKQFKTENKL